MPWQQLHRKKILTLLGAVLVIAICVGCVSAEEASVLRAGAKNKTTKSGLDGRYERDRKMNMRPQPSYGQAFANAQLNSVVGINLTQFSPRLGKPIELSLLDAGSPPDVAEWLLSDGDAMIAVGQMQHWIVQLDKELIEATTPSTPSLFALLGQGNYIHAADTCLGLRGPDLAQYVEGEEDEDYDDVPYGTDDDDEDDEENDDDERIMVVHIDGWRSDSSPLAFFQKDDDVVMVFQNYAHPGNPNAKDIVMLRKRLGGEMDSIKWMKEYDAYGARSPVLSDGTVVLCREDQVQLINMDGQEVGKIETQLMAGMVSVDFEDTIWGLQQRVTGMHLLRFSPTGIKLVEIDLPTGKPVQPPVTLLDGRILVATLDRILCVQNRALLWEFPLPAKSEELEWNLGFNGGQDPLVTATVNNKILVKQQGRLWLIDEGPEPVWEIVVPDNEPITSNPVITTDGNVCFACTRKLFCLAP